MKSRNIIYLLLLLLTLIVIFTIPKRVPYPRIYHDSEETQPLSSSTHPLQTDWYQRWSGQQGPYSFFRGAVLDSSENIIIAADHRYWLYLIKYNKTGDLQWSINQGESTPHAIAIDSLDNIYVVGSVFDYVTKYDFYLVKFNSSGDYQWHRVWGGMEVDTLNAIVIDSSDLIYVAGYSESYSDGGDADFYVAKYNSAGVRLRTFLWGGAGYEACFDIALDSLNNIFIAGTTNSYGAGNTDVCLLKLSNSWNFEWYRTWGGIKSESANGIAIDSMDNIYLAGTSGTFGLLIDMVLLKYDMYGNLEWDVKWHLISRSNIASDVAIDSYDNVYLAGDLQNSGTMVLLKFNKFGIKQWHMTWGVLDDTNCATILLDSANNIYLAGNSGYSICLVKFHAVLDITINLPFVNQVNGNNPPIYDINVVDKNLEEIWYSVNWGTNISISDIVGEINSSIWSSCLNGSVLIHFFANNSYGDIAFKEIIVHKDIIAPKITINSPVQHQLVGNKTINFDLTIIEANLNSTWYSLNLGNNHTFTGSSGIIDQNAWDMYGNGTILIRFYANDSIGNMNFTNVTVRKDTIQPEIIVISPKPYTLYGNNTFSFELFMDEPNLNSTWYSLNMGENHTFTGTTGTIDQDTWDKCEDGAVLIRFYANDSGGNLNYDEVSVQKDSIKPEIIIVSPKPYQLYGNDTISFELIINDPNLNFTWFSLNSSKNYTFTGSSGVIDQNAWDMCGNGTVLIRFYANDSVGNMNFNNVTIRKNTYFPEITIITPIAYQLCGNDTISYELNIEEPNLVSTWYSLNGGNNNTFTGTSGSINQTAWNSCGNGTVIIRFYAINTAGNTAYMDVIVLKDTSFPEIAIISPEKNQACGNTTIAYELIIEEPNLVSTWYTLNGSMKFLFSNKTGIIDPTLWSSFGNGTLTLSFYANNTAGNSAIKSITIHKDIINPQLTIITPIAYQLYGKNALSFDITINEANLESTWYSLNGSSYNFFTGTVGTIKQSVWDAFGNGTLSLFFYANDSSGNLAFTNITIRKDILDPNITINSPTLNELFETTAPSFNVEIYDANLDSMWYTLDNGLTNMTFTENNTIDQSVWDALLDGNAIIRFYANDSAGNIGFAEVTVRKDVNAPIITINNPQNSDVIGTTAPNFDLSIEEPNLDKTWYLLNGGNNITFTGLIETINQALWDALSDGNVIIRFYANDTLGRIGFKEVTVVKTIPQPSPPEIPGYNILLLLGIVSTMAVIIARKRLNHLN